LYIKSGNTFSVNPDDKIDARQKLPTGTYTVMFDMDRGFFLETNPAIEIKHKVYGNAHTLADRILNTYDNRSGNTGVLLSGNKGSGKTLLAKLLSINGLKNDIITIYVNQAFVGESFNKFISTITQPAIIMIDEFEKIYPADKQEALLTLFDGLYPSRKLFIVTVNDTHRMSDFMLNRPGRFFYHLKYGGLSKEEIIEFCEDNLKDKKKIDTIVQASTSIRKMSYDILSAIVEEMNRYSEDVKDVLKVLNVDITPRASTYKIIETLDKKTGGPIITSAKHVHISPSVNDLSFAVWDSEEDKKKDKYEENTHWVNMSPETIKQIKAGKFTYEDDDHRVVIAEKGQVDFGAIALEALY